jgi:hypothetical protein
VHPDFVKILLYGFDVFISPVSIKDGIKSPGGFLLLSEENSGVLGYKLVAGQY